MLWKLQMLCKHYSENNQNDPRETKCLLIFSEIFMNINKSLICELYQEMY